jgi:hypothetical protein
LPNSPAVQKFPRFARPELRQPAKTLHRSAEEIAEKTSTVFINFYSVLTVMFIFAIVIMTTDIIIIILALPELKVND